MIDIHTHILPMVDDGSKNLKESLELLHQELNNGVNEVILTPHQNQRNLDKKRIQFAFEEFVKAVDLPIKLYLGCELMYYEGVLEAVKKGLVQTLNDSKYILIEFSTIYETNISDIVYELNIMGYCPIVAHIEKYGYLKTEDYKAIHANGGFIQINADSFSIGTYYKRIKKLLKMELVDFIASDCHNLQKRNVDFSTAKTIIKKKFPNSYDKLFNKTLF